jgi:hydroxymethylpyrimidine kinase/phosphomethylpyrimidine kinase
MRRKVPSALTIAGSDSGGGAGIQADLKTFVALGVHGTSAVTCITAQNPKTVLSIHAVPVGIVCDQIKAVLTEFPPQAVKTGMLYSAEIIRGVAKALARTPVPLVVDPVMISTSGTELLKGDAVAALREELFPRAALLTPNVPELKFLLRARITTPEELRSAARALYAQCRCAVLAKGGHLRSRQAIDFYFDGSIELMLEAPRVAGIATHGTGCTYSAAITAHLALGRKLPDAVTAAKELISMAIAQSDKCGRHFVLNTASA